MKQRVILSLGFFLLVSISVIPLAHSMNLQVTATAASCSDCDPTNACSGNCGDPGTQCPFQDALNIAQCNGEADTITLAAGTYDPTTVLAADNTCQADGFCYNGNENAEDSSLTITGAGTGQTFIDGGGAAITGLTISPFADVDDGLTLSITGITFQNNGPVSGVGAGGLLVFLQNANATIELNEFINNGGEQSNGGGGASLSAAGTGNFLVNRNAFFDNQALSGVVGGGLSVELTEGNLTLTNNIFAGNLAENELGGGAALFSFEDGSFTVVNNTFFNNTGAAGGGIAFGVCETNPIDVYNNIVYQNIAPAGGEDIIVVALGGLGSGISCAPDGTVNVFNNDFINAEYLPPTITVNEGSNLNIDPEWVNSGADDFHLTAGSPVIDQGDLNPPGGLPNPDFDGVTRPQGPLPDMGALEFQAIPTPTPTPSPTPTPPVTGLLLFGSGCNLASGAEAFPFLQWVLAVPIFLGLRRYLRR